MFFMKVEFSFLKKKEENIEMFCRYLKGLCLSSLTRKTKGNGC